MSDKKDVEFLQIESVNVNGLQVYQQDKALIDMQIATAKNYPRNLKKCLENAITTVTMNDDVADSCTYSLNKGGTVITGPSVYLARILVQELGNIRVDNRVVGFDEKHVTCEATCFDLEKNIASRTTIKRSIFGKNGRYSEDMCTIVGNAGIAIALRNAVFNVVSQAFTDTVWESAKNKITGNLSDTDKLLKRRVKVFTGFQNSYSSLKITDEEICASVGRSSPDHITKDDILVLIGYEKSLAAGEMKPLELFRPDKSIPVPTKYPSDKSEERIIAMIGSCSDTEELKKLLANCTTQASVNAYDAKMKILKDKK